MQSRLQVRQQFERDGKSALNMTNFAYSNLQVFFRDSSREKLDFRFIAAALFALTAGILGGGGSYFPLQELVVQLTALAALYFVLRDHDGRLKAAFQSRQARPSLYLLIAAAVLILLQLMPLPPAIWQALPGRELLTDAAILLGEENSWRSISIDPEQTMFSSLAIIIPAAGFLIMLSLDADRRRIILWLILVAIVLHLCVAVMQSASGGSDFYLYNTAHKGMPIGLFGNRNHMAMMLVLGICISSPLIVRRFDVHNIGQSATMIALALVLTMGILATNSRSGAALALLTIIFIALVSCPQKYRKIGYLGIAATLLGMAAFLTLTKSIGQYGVLTEMVERFDQVGDHRYEFWPMTVQTLSHYFPFGAGIGCFDTAYRTQETLDLVGTHFVNHAHNDYIEIVIETGIFGLALLSVFLVIFSKSMFSAFSVYSRGGKDTLPIFSGLAIVCILLHSLVDYPTRSYAIAMTASMLLAILITPSEIDENTGT